MGIQLALHPSTKSFWISGANAGSSPCDSVTGDSIIISNTFCATGESSTFDLYWNCGTFFSLWVNDVKVAADTGVGVGFFSLLTASINWYTIYASWTVDSSCTSSIKISCCCSRCCWHWQNFKKKERKKELLMTEAGQNPWCVWILAPLGQHQNPSTSDILLSFRYCCATGLILVRWILVGSLQKRHGVLGFAWNALFTTGLRICKTSPA